VKKEGGEKRFIRRPSVFFAKTVAIFLPVTRRLFRVQSSDRLWPACAGLEARVREANGSGFLCACSRRACVKLFVRHTAFLMLPSAPCCDEGVEGNSIPRIGR
jgi:hypothetical protein